MKRNWTDEELTEHWLLTDNELALLPNRVDYNRLGCAVQLKFFDIEGRFPRSPHEIPPAALCFVANQLRISPSVFSQYNWQGRARKNHRADIRAFLGFRSFTAGDTSTLELWLRQAIMPSDQNLQHLYEAVLEWCRDHRLEPPTRHRIERLIRSALHRYETEFFDAIVQKIPPTKQARLDGLLEPAQYDAPSAPTSDEAAIVVTPFGQLKTDPGPVGLASVLKELAKWAVK